MANDLSNQLAVLQSEDQSREFEWASETPAERLDPKILDSIPTERMKQSIAVLRSKKPKEKFSPLKILRGIIHFPIRVCAYLYHACSIELQEEEDRYHEFRSMLESEDARFLEQNIGLRFQSSESVDLSNTTLIKKLSKSHLDLYTVQIDLSPITKNWTNSNMQSLNLKGFGLQYATPVSRMKFLEALFKIKTLRNLDLSDNALLESLTLEECGMVGKWAGESGIVVLKIFDTRPHTTGFDPEPSLLKSETTSPSKLKDFSEWLHRLSLKSQAFLQGFTDNTTLQKMDSFELAPYFQQFDHPHLTALCKDWNKPFNDALQAKMQENRRRYNALVRQALVDFPLIIEPLAALVFQYLSLQPPISLQPPKLPGKAAAAKGPQSCKKVSIH